MNMIFTCEINVHILLTFCSSCAINYGSSLIAVDEVTLNASLGSFVRKYIRDK